MSEPAAGRPLIAVTGMRSPMVTGLRRRGIVAAEKVLDAVYRAGGDPVVLAPLDRPDIPSLAAFAGLVVPGGADLDPSTYGGVRTSATEPSDLLQDRFDLAVSKAAIAVGMPYLAICRGMQVLNVALGGSLVDHLPPSDVPHRDAFHDVTLEPGCAVALAMGTSRPSVSSYHHQGLDRLGDGLRVTGRTADGCPEAVEHRTSPVLAVQWHPEDDAETSAAEQGLFDAVVEQARRWTSASSSAPAGAAR
jgi:putative glutamine amidotransferase